MLLIFQHIAEDMVRLTLDSTHFRDFFSGKEGDLPVGFPDRFNSSFYYFSFFTTYYETRYLLYFSTDLHQTW